MSNPQRIKIPKLGDKTLLSALSLFAKEIGASQIYAQPFGWPHSIQIPLDAALPAEIAGVVSNSSSVLYTVGVGVAGVNANIYRGGQTTGTDFSPSAIYDEIVIGVSSASIPAPQMLAAVDKLQRALRAFDPKRVTELSGETGLAQLAAIHSSTLEKLEAVASEVVVDYDKRRQLLSEEYEKKRNALDEGFQSKNAVLTGEHADKLAALRKKEEQFEKRRQELDDKDNTHARRDIQRKLLSELKSRQTLFGLTENTIKLRTPVRRTLWALIAALAVAAIVSLAHITYSNATDFAAQSLLLGKAAVSTIALVLALLFYARWENKWAERHADAEFAVKQFELDIERASWLVETALEWRDKNETKLPDSIIAALSANLFAHGQSTSEDPLKHPADQLASALFGSANKATLRVGDHDIEVNPKKIKPPSRSVKKEGN